MFYFYFYFGFILVPTPSGDGLIRPLREFLILLAGFCNWVVASMQFLRFTMICSWNSAISAMVIFCHIVSMRVTTIVIVVVLRSLNPSFRSITPWSVRLLCLLSGSTLLVASFCCQRLFHCFDFLFEIADGDGIRCC